VTCGTRAGSLCDGVGYTPLDVPSQELPIRAGQLEVQECQYFLHCGGSEFLVSRDLIHFPGYLQLVIVGRTHNQVAKRRRNLGQRI
jgi:hypothetical protein